MEGYIKIIDDYATEWLSEKGCENNFLSKDTLTEISNSLALSEEQRKLGNFEGAGFYSGLSTATLCKNLLAKQDKDTQAYPKRLHKSR